MGKKKLPIVYFENATYEGDLVDGKPWGSGYISFENTDRGIIRGRWKNGVCVQGTQKFQSLNFSNNIFKGSFDKNLNMRQGKITIGKYTAKRSSNQIFSFAGNVFEGTFKNHNAPKETINLDKILVKKGRVTNKKGKSASLNGSISCLLNGRGSVELFDKNGKTLQCFEGVYKMGRPWKGFAQDASRSRIVGKYQDGKFINADDLVSTRMTRSKSRSMHQGNTSANGTATQASSVAVAVSLSVSVVASNTTNSTSSTTAAATAVWTHPANCKLCHVLCKSAFPKSHYCTMAKHTAVFAMCESHYRKSCEPRAP